MLRLEAEGVSALIDPARGGRLASLDVGGRELLVGPSGPDDTSIRWGCYLMAPWAGRLADGRFRWRNRTLQLPRTHGRHAIHGLTWGRPWRVEAADGAHAVLSCPLLLAEWPMGGIVRQSYTLTGGSLTLGATIEAGDAMPAVLGWHPWFLRGDDPVRLAVDAAFVEETVRMVPTGRTLPAVERLDLRHGPVLGSRRLDHAYVGARSPAVIEWPDLRVTLSFEPSPASVVVYTPAHAVCVEPQTAPPNALATGGATMLDAGERFSATVVLAWTRPAASAAD